MEMNEGVSATALVVWSFVRCVLVKRDIDITALAAPWERSQETPAFPGQLNGLKTAPFSSLSALVEGAGEERRTVSRHCILLHHGNRGIGNHRPGASFSWPGFLVGTPSELVGKACGHTNWDDKRRFLSRSDKHTKRHDRISTELTHPAQLQTLGKVFIAQQKEVQPKIYSRDDGETPYP